MVIPHRTITNRDKIREAIINKIQKISLDKRQHPIHSHVKAKFLYLKEPIGKKPFRVDRIDQNHPYHEDKNYPVSWSTLTTKELFNMYTSVKSGETYCFYLEKESFSKKINNEDNYKWQSL